MPRLAPVTAQVRPSRPRSIRSASSRSATVTEVSPASTLWTGHLAAIGSRRRRCSSLELGGSFSATAKVEGMAPS